MVPKQLTQEEGSEWDIHHDSLQRRKKNACESPASICYMQRFLPHTSQARPHLAEDFHHSLSGQLDYFFLKVAAQYWAQWSC